MIKSTNNKIIHLFELNEDVQSDNISLDTLAKFKISSDENSNYGRELQKGYMMMLSNQKNK